MPRGQIGSVSRVRGHRGTSSRGRGSRLLSTPVNTSPCHMSSFGSLNWAINSAEYSARLSREVEEALDLSSYNINLIMSDSDGSSDENDDVRDYNMGSSISDVGSSSKEAAKLNALVIVPSNDSNSMFTIWPNGPSGRGSRGRGTPRQVPRCGPVIREPRRLDANLEAAVPIQARTYFVDPDPKPDCPVLIYTHTAWAANQVVSNVNPSEILQIWMTYDRSLLYFEPRGLPLPSCRPMEGLVYDRGPTHLNALGAESGRHSNGISPEAFAQLVSPP